MHLLDSLRLVSATRQVPGDVILDLQTAGDVVRLGGGLKQVRSRFNPTDQSRLLPSADQFLLSRNLFRISCAVSLQPLPSSDFLHFVCDWQDGNFVVAARAGALRSSRRGLQWVDSAQKRVSPQFFHELPSDGFVLCAKKYFISFCLTHY